MKSGTALNMSKLHKVHTKQTFKRHDFYPQIRVSYISIKYEYIIEHVWLVFSRSHFLPGFILKPISERCRSDRSSWSDSIVHLNVL